MRTTFIETLCKIAAQDERIWLLTADLGYSVVECFAHQFSERFVNTGVAEQNMTGIAAGLAMSGKIIFTYSIANFPVVRCLEQIRNDICYHNLNVKIVAVGGGMAYGGAGYTHHALEDLAIMRVMPNMVVIAPGDPVETKLALKAITRHTGPCYLRLGMNNEPVIHKEEPHFEIGKAIQIKEGEDVIFISTGPILNTIVQTADVLTRKGFSIGVYSMPTIHPIDQKAIIFATTKAKCIISVEEHGPGGLGSAISEVLASVQVKTKFVSMHTNPSLIHLVGSQEYLLQRNELSVRAIVQKTLSILDH